MYNTDYLEMSQRRFENQRREYNMKNGIQIFIKDKMTNNVKLKNVLDVVNSYIPSHLLGEIDSIYIGMFDDFEKKEVNAAYKDGAIYVSNEQDNEQDLIDDLVHEIAHSLEQPYGYTIYADQKLENEFLAKRKKLYEILEAEGLNPDLELFMETEYNPEMDQYLYKDGLFLCKRKCIFLFLFGQCQAFLELLFERMVSYLLEDICIASLVDFEGLTAVGADNFVHIKIP